MTVFSAYLLEVEMFVLTRGCELDWHLHVVVVVRTIVTLLYTLVFLLVIEGHVTLMCGISVIVPRLVNTERVVYVK